jgi:hypothetical protein
VTRAATPVQGVRPGQISWKVAKSASGARAVRNEFHFDDSSA